MLAQRIAVVAAALAAVATLPTDARADDDQSVLIVPLTGATDAINVALEKAVANAGLDGVLAQVSREELTAVAGCETESLDCFLQVAETLGANQVVMGEVATSDGGLDVTLNIGVRGGEPRTVTFRVDSGDAAVFEKKATAFLSGEEVPADPPPKPDPPPDRTPDPTPTPDPPIVTPTPVEDDGFSFGRVKGYSWGVAGGGLAVAATGLVFLGIADGKQQDVDDHPTDTVEDLEALAELEDDGKRFNRIGNGMLVVGGVAAAVGVTLIILQGRDAPEQREPGVTVTPMPVRGGAGVAITYDGWSW